MAQFLHSVILRQI